MGILRVGIRLIIVLITTVVLFGLVGYFVMNMTAVENKANFPQISSHTIDEILTIAQRCTEGSHQMLSSKLGVDLLKFKITSFEDIPNVQNTRISTSSPLSISPLALDKISPEQPKKNSILPRNYHAKVIAYTLFSMPVATVLVDNEGCSRMH